MENQREFEQSVTEFVREALWSIPMPLRVNQPKCLVAIPVYFQEIILRQLRLENGTTAPYFTWNGNDRFLYGWKVVPGYEPAIVVFLPEAVVMSEYVFKIPIEAKIEK